MVSNDTYSDTLLRDHRRMVITVSLCSAITGLWSIPTSEAISSRWPICFLNLGDGLVDAVSVMSA